MNKETKKQRWIALCNFERMVQTFYEFAYSNEWLSIPSLRLLIRLCINLKDTMNDGLVHSFFSTLVSLINRSYLADIGDNSVCNVLCMYILYPLWKLRSWNWSSWNNAVHSLKVFLSASRVGWRWFGWQSARTKGVFIASICTGVQSNCVLPAIIQARNLLARRSLLGCLTAGEEWAKGWSWVWDLWCLLQGLEYRRFGVPSD